MLRVSVILVWVSALFCSAQEIDVSTLDTNVWAESESRFVPQDPRLKPYLEVSFKPTLDTQLPLDLEFMGDDGKRTTLRERMVPGKPTLFAFVYYRCPTMCNLMLNGMIDALKEIHYSPGKEFSIIALSFDARETHVVAAGKKENALKRFGEGANAEAWHFLVGEERSVAELTRAANFSYKYDPVDDQFAHGSGLLVLTPDGRISRFLPGVLYPNRDLELSLVEAGEGKIGKLSDRLALLCYHYDPETGKYGLVVDRTLKIACFSTVGILALLIGSLLYQEHRKKNPEVQKGAAPDA